MASPTPVCLVVPSSRPLVSLALAAAALLCACRSAPVRDDCAGGRFLYTDRRLGSHGSIEERPVYACGDVARPDTVGQAAAPR